MQTPQSMVVAPRLSRRVQMDPSTSGRDCACRKYVNVCHLGSQLGTIAEHASRRECADVHQLSFLEASLNLPTLGESLRFIAKQLSDSAEGRARRGADFV